MNDKSIDYCGIISVLSVHIDNDITHIHNKIIEDVRVAGGIKSAIKIAKYVDVDIDSKQEIVKSEILSMVLRYGYKYNTELYRIVVQNDVFDMYCECICFSEDTRVSYMGIMRGLLPDSTIFYSHMNIEELLELYDYDDDEIRLMMINVEKSKEINNNGLRLVNMMNKVYNTYGFRTVYTSRRYPNNMIEQVIINETQDISDNFIYYTYLDNANRVGYVLRIPNQRHIIVSLYKIFKKRRYNKLSKVLTTIDYVEGSYLPMITHLKYLSKFYSSNK